MTAGEVIATGRRSRSTDGGVAYFVYANGHYPAAALTESVAFLQNRGLRIAGLIERNKEPSRHSHCDMELEDIATGRRISIAEDRGQAATACRLDLSGLALAYAAVKANFAAADLVVVSKFGKTEAEGGGLRGLVAEAMEAQVPVLVGLPERCLSAWMDFAGEYGRPLQLNGAALYRWLAA
ncbi:MAG TPA: DUF2478 domain-containing protein [Ferrovibrio sp.]|uniref:DUF2478 domain-containing protein n=1 Tax=Ferrovibrio sp. TaxID=1917215 RepID=UPI002ED65224